MFYGCESLTKAPELPADCLAEYCYREMFNSCKNLNYIKADFTRCWIAERGVVGTSNYIIKAVWSCLYNWVKKVSKEGTFVTNYYGKSLLEYGNSGIPKNWKISEE